MDGLRSTIFESTSSVCSGVHWIYCFQVVRFRYYMVMLLRVNTIYPAMVARQSSNVISKFTSLSGVHIFPSKVLGTWLLVNEWVEQINPNLVRMCPINSYVPAPVTWFIRNFVLELLWKNHFFPWLKQDINFVDIQYIQHPYTNTSFSKANSKDWKINFSLILMVIGTEACNILSEEHF